jgi:hypothetical protein
MGSARSGEMASWLSQWQSAGSGELRPDRDYLYVVLPARYAPGGSY